MEQVFGEGWLEAGELDLGFVADKEASASSPVLLCSMPGFDPSYRVDDLAARTRRPYKSLAIGSAEGFDLAEKAIQAAAKVRTCVASSF